MDIQEVMEENDNGGSDSRSENGLEAESEDEESEVLSDDSDPEEETDIRQRSRYWRQETIALLSEEKSRILLDATCSQIELAVLAWASVESAATELVVWLEFFLSPELVPELVYLIQKCATLRSVTFFDRCRTFDPANAVSTIRLMGKLMVAVARSSHVHRLVLIETVLRVASLVHLLESNETIQELVVENVISDCSNENVAALEKACRLNRGIVNLSLRHDHKMWPQLLLTIGRNLASHLSSLTLSYWCDGPLVRDFVEGSKFDSLSLTLENVDIDAENGQEIVEAFASSTKRLSLKLRYCYFADPSNLRSMVERSLSLADIEIDGPLGDAWPSFCLGMTANQSVEKAAFRYFEWADHDGLLWMTNHPALRELVLNECVISGEGLNLTGLTSLTAVYMSWDVHDIRALLRNENASSLRNLTLHLVDVYDEGALVLAQWLRGHTSLTVLELWGCEVTEDGLASLLDTVVVNRTLRDLRLSSCDLTDGQILADRLPLIQGLQKLVLGDIHKVPTDLLYSSLDQNHSILRFVALKTDTEPYDMAKVQYYGLRNRCQSMRFLSTSTWPRLIYRCLTHKDGGGPSAVFDMLSSRAQALSPQSNKRRRPDE